MTSSSQDRDGVSPIPTSGTSPASRSDRPVPAPSGRTAPPTAPPTAPTAPSTGPRDARRAPGEQVDAGTEPRGKGKAGADRKSSSGGDWNVFRTVVVLVGTVIAGFGAYYLILGTAGLPDVEADPVNPTLENQFRFFSAMMIGVGAAFITIAIKFQWANMLWLVCLMVFVGGIGRVLSWAFSGTPNYVLIILMVVELAFPPALLVWHKYIAKTAAMRKEFAQRG